MRGIYLVLGLIAYSESDQAPLDLIAEGQMHFNLGPSHPYFQHFPEAIVVYERVLALMLDLPQVYYNLANVYFRSTREIEPKSAIVEP